MRCPHCKSDNIRVIDSLPGGSSTTYRRRKCKDCNGLFHTVEIIDNGQNPAVAKGYSDAMRRKNKKRLKNK